ncbi:MAG TPA: ABC transporter ATP-binding protein [Dokdonella sp.]
MSSDGGAAPLREPVETAIRAAGLGKCYQLYAKPLHRMLQSLVGDSHRFYREFWALRGLDFDVRRGETLGVIGRNGSGKSTLLQLIAGTLKPSEGAVEVCGKVAALLELGSGFNPEFTGRENVYLNASILGLARAEIDARLADILAFADIGEFVDQPVRSYSTGMVVRLAFAVAVHVDAEILIIDEALAVGDAFFMQKCMRFLRGFKKHGTLLLVSHDAGAISALCDRALWLDQGRMRALGDTRTVIDAYLEATLLDRQGGAGAGAGGADARRSGLPRRRIDPRRELLDRSQLRNDIHVLPFDPDASAFGDLRARVTDVVFTDAGGRPVSHLIGGESVVLEVSMVADAPLGNAILGFYVKDRHGQLLFGDNTYLSYRDGFPVEAGETFRARFEFEMPRLANGDYFVTIGLSEGTQDQHVVQHWIHEALTFTSTGGDIVTGLIGLPMQEITLERVRRDG